MIIFHICFWLTTRRCESIIDCFEVKIEKPLLAVPGVCLELRISSTASYISATTDGLIIFVCCGRPGRTSDMDLMRSSGYPAVCAVVQRFWLPGVWFWLKTELTITKRGCLLVRPPSVRNNEMLEADEVVRMRTVAGPRIHIERSIARVRLYKMLAMYSGIPLSMADLIDSIVRIASGLANLDKRIVKS